MGRFDKLSKLFNKTPEELEKVYNNFKKFNKTISTRIDEDGNIISSALNKNNKMGEVDLYPHSAEMMEEIVTNPKYLTDSPYYLSEIQAKQGEGLGKRLLDEALYNAEKNGADSVYLQADPTINKNYNQSELSESDLNDFYKKNKFVQPNESTNFGATPFVRDLSKNPALDMSTKARFLRSVEQGYIPTNKDNILLNPKTGNERSVNASFDPDLINKKGKYFGVAAIPGLNEFSEDVAKPLVSRWEKLKSYVTNPLSKQLDLTKDKSASEDIKTALDLGLDPTNLVGGAPGAVLGGIQLLGSDDEEEK